MSTQAIRHGWINIRTITILVLVLLAAAAIAWQAQWLAPLQDWLTEGQNPNLTAAHSDDDHVHSANDGHDHSKHDAGHSHADDKHSHDHPGHSEENSITLSKQARSTMGLKVEPVVLQDFDRKITIPGMVVEQPGRSQLAITAPLTGVITRIYALAGEAVVSGDLLFEVRLTHEELVQSQGDFLKTIEELDVINREVKRLEVVSASGAIAGKTLLERQYEKQKTEAVLRAQRQALQLHGLSEQQVDQIVADRKLLSILEVRVPAEKEDTSKSDKASSDTAEKAADPAKVVEIPPTIYQVQALMVEQGQHVTAGDNLALLADHSQLLIEGSAFEKDLAEISRAIEQQVKVTAIVDTDSSKPRSIKDLSLLYLAGTVDATNRTIHFYVRLPNRITGDTGQKEKTRFVDWEFKPGQRMSLQVPIEKPSKRIVLPIGAVAQAGAESYVFIDNGDHFDRQAVHIEYKDQHVAVIANDNSLRVKQRVVTHGAQQLLLALTNKSSGPVDPHAGHSH
ncbi:MAG: efflux RND transporter periplasmic adaptor subunit [Planctomycetota bacterium]|nr:efflux RND transporter periplasmic adaptor subunit [Planctomycetota bacterium]